MSRDDYSIKSLDIDSSIVNENSEYGMGKPLGFKPNSDEVVGSVYQYDQLVNTSVFKEFKNSKLKVGLVSEKRLLEGLEFECELYVLTPDNWRYVIQYIDLDFLLFESIWTSATGHWNMAMNGSSSEFEELTSIVDNAKKKNIPTVFWNTKGKEYHLSYIAIAKHFDVVFCADPNVVELLKLEGIQSQVLLPCVQPALFNPFVKIEDKNEAEISILFDGWADLDRISKKLDVFKRLDKFGLKIIESRYQVFKSRLKDLPDFQNSILGCVSGNQRIHLLKKASSYVTSIYSISNSTTQQWMSLEAAACRLSVVSFGKLEQNDIRNDFVIQCSNESELLIEYTRQAKDKHYAERIAHHCWRNVHSKHTFAHRISTICSALSIDYEWEEFPKVSLIAPTFRKHQLQMCVENYQRQSYPNKELVIVFNGNEPVFHKDLNVEDTRDDILIDSVPTEMFAGAALNNGYMRASGAYYFRFDDDDLYARNYVLDMILLARSIDASYFGKPPCPLRFADESKLYKPKQNWDLSVVQSSDIKSGKHWFGGNSLSGKAEFLNKYSFQSNVYGAADTHYNMNLPNDSEHIFAFMDSFNLIANREKDSDAHTWKIDEDKIKSSRIEIKDSNEIII